MDDLEDLEFLDDNSIGNETFYCLDKGVRRYIMEHRRKELKNMESTLKQYSVKIKAGENADTFLLSGTKIGIARVRAALHVLTSSVVLNEMKIQQPGLSKYLATEKGDRLVKSVEHEHKCAIENVSDLSLWKAKKPGPSQGSVETSSSNESDGDDFAAQAQAYPSPYVASVPMSMTSGNVRVSWKQGNIEAEDADIIVGSTIGQLSRVFETAGVAMIQPHWGKLSVVSQPQCGNLSCDHVLLTKCCSWDNGSSFAEKQLRSVIQQCLQQALQLNASSIAFPIFGIGGLGLNAACQIMISEVINETIGFGPSSLDDVRFVVFAQDTLLVTAFKEEFILILGPSPSIRAKPFGDVLVQVLQGDLTQQQTDAIVNIIGTDMNMQNAGVLSRVVAQVAGQDVQDECNLLSPQPVGSAVITGPGNLKQIRNIIQVIPGKLPQPCIERCLQVADNHGFGSVSLPAVGTGKSGMSGADSAQATFQALANVCPDLQNLKELTIVISQTHMFLTFQQTLQQYLPGSKTPEHLDDDDDTKMSLQFRLFGKRKDCVDKAQKALTKGLTEACITHALENDDASKLSERQRNKLITKARELDVTIKFEDRIGRIVVRGDPDDVSTIVNSIWKEIQERGKKEKESEQAEVLYRTVKWQYELNGTRRYFNKSANAVIEKAHANDDTRVTVEVQGETYVIVFAHSTGTGKFTGQTMSVMRTTVGSHGNHGQWVVLPKEWCPMPLDGSGTEVTVHLLDLAFGSAECQKVLKLFQRTGGSGDIIKVERIQNPHLYQQYMVRKQKMDKDNIGMNNERQLFHGTSEKNVDVINATGFNRSFSGTANGNLYGDGVYFATNASFSYTFAQPDRNNYRYMYVARVLVGRYTKGYRGMKVPPYQGNRKDKSFDSVADYYYHGVKDASIFVVFYDSQCYPEYLITFQ